MTDNQQDKPDLDRRRFIHGAGAGALALGSAGIVSSNAMAGQDASACKTPGCDYDVVVIGDSPVSALPGTAAKMAFAPCCWRRVTGWAAEHSALSLPATR